MLKIKDNINLEELRKYGFEYINKAWRIISKKSIMPSEKAHLNKHYAMTIFTNRKIQISPSGKDNIYEILYDMIVDGIVERGK